MEKLNAMVPLPTVLSRQHRPVRDFLFRPVIVEYFEKPKLRASEKNILKKNSANNYRLTNSRKLLTQVQIKNSGCAKGCL